MKVLYFGTYQKTYARNRLIIDGLRKARVVVHECQRDLWGTTNERVELVVSGWRKPKTWILIAQTYVSLIKEFFNYKDYDAIVVGYPGYLDVFLARIMAWVKHKPLVWDVLMSVYLISIDRNLQKESRLSIWLIAQLEKLALRLPDRLVIDTAVYRDWFVKKYRIKADRFRLLPIGADNRYFKPQSTRTLPKKKEFNVIYYGSYIPNHGTKYIIQAANILKEIPYLMFYMVGAGPDLTECRGEVKRLKLSNVIFIDWLAKKDLVPLINNSDVVLGSFGLVNQSLLTIHNKVYEGMAARKAVITGDSPAIQDVFTNKKELLLCERGNAKSLAQAILLLHSDDSLKKKIEKEGHAYYLANSTLEITGNRMMSIIKELCEGEKSHA